MKNLFAPVFLVSILLLSLVHAFDISLPEVWCTLALAAFVPALAFYGVKRYTVCYCLIVLAVGLLLGSRLMMEKESFLDTRQSLPVSNSEHVTVLGELSRYPVTGNGNSTVTLAARAVRRKEGFVPFHANVRVKVAGDMRGFFRGDTVEISLRMYEPTFNRNFEKNPLEDYYFVQRIHFTGYCKSPRLVSLVSPAPLPWRLLGKWRNSLRSAVENQYGTDSNAKGVFLQAILLGDRGKLTIDNKEKLIDAGIFHLLAISGAHIGIIVMLSLWVLGKFGVPGKKKVVITTVVLVLFLALSGFKVSAERAVWMAVLFFAARMFCLDINIYNIISLCGLFMLIRNPAAFLDAGFILTFTLTAAIAAGRELFLPLFRRLKESPLAVNAARVCRGSLERIIKRPGKKSSARDWMEKGKNNSPGVVWELLSANISASLMSFPLSLYYFQRCSFGGFFSGLILVPLTGIIIALGFLLLLSAPLSPVLSSGILMLADIPLTVFFAVTSLFSGPLNLHVFGAPPPAVWVVMVPALFFIWGMLKKKKPRIAAGVSFFVLLTAVLLWSFFFSYSPGHLEVFYLDVGQGDCTTVVFPGGDALLIDGGGTHYSDFQVGRYIVLPFLVKNKIRVKWVAVSHFHPDHGNGIADILQVIKPEELWISAEPTDSHTYRRVMAAVPPGTTIKRIKAPFRKEINGCRVELLYPNEIIGSPRAKNNHSQVIRVSGAYHSFLFPGDIEREAELELSRTGCSQLGSTVLKVPHHGSRSSSTPRFLECAAPRLAVFSYARNNRFGFPHRSVTVNYLRKKIPTLSTGRSGGIRIISRGKELLIKTSK